MAMTPEEMEAAIIDLQTRMTAMEARADNIATYPFMAYEQGESIGGQGPGTAEQGSTTQIWKNFNKIKQNG
jgi:hypothetical protein